MSMFVTVILVNENSVVKNTYITADDILLLGFFGGILSVINYCYRTYLINLKENSNNFLH